MSVGTWWKSRSGAGKAIIVASVLLVLQIAGLLATQTITLWADAQFHIPRGEGWGTFGLVLWEFLFLAANVLVIATALVWLAVHGMRGKRATK
jgi:hypothetical protein